MAKRKILEIPKRMVSCKVEEVTPSMAKEWLKNNPQNCPLDENLVRSYEEKMRRGEWTEKQKWAAPIIVMKEGGLINGQHRLSALVRYGKSVRMQVAVYSRLFRE